MIHLLEFHGNLFFILLFSIQINLLKANCTPANENIGCGGSRFQNISHLVQTCEYPIDTIVTLPDCRRTYDDTYLFWYDKSYFCEVKPSPVGQFFALFPPSTNQPCTDSTSNNISAAMCTENYDFNNSTMIIKNLTQKTALTYICFLGPSQTRMNPESAVTYIVRIQEPSKSSKSYLHIILPSVLVPVAVLLIIVVIGIIYFRKRRKEKTGDDHSMEWFPSPPSRPAIPSDSRGPEFYSRSPTSDGSQRAWRPIKPRS